MQFYDINSNKVDLPKGEKIHWRISSYAICKSSDDKILMVKCCFDDRWQLPGGGVEPDETIFEGVSREFYEETGYKMKDQGQEPFLVNQGYFFDNAVSKKFYHSVNFFYLVELTSDKQDKDAINRGVELEGEIVDVKWFPLSEINKENCHPMDFKAIKKL